MHSHFMKQTTEILKKSADLEEFKTYFEQHRKSRRASSSQRKDSSSSQNDKSSSNSTEQTSQENSREFRTDSELLKAFKKQSEFLIDISPVHQVPNLL